MVSPGSKFKTDYNKYEIDLLFLSKKLNKIYFWTEIS